MVEERMTRINTKPETRMVAILAQYDVQPVRSQRAISWCTTHGISKNIPNPNPHADRPDHCLLADYREGECVISTGGPDHDWWVDL